jgi:hypothetical protein
MIFWPFCAFIWFKNIEKMLLQITSGFLQLESTIYVLFIIIILKKSETYCNEICENLFLLQFAMFIMFSFDPCDFKLCLQ